MWDKKKEENGTRAIKKGNVRFLFMAKNMSALESESESSSDCLSNVRSTSLEGDKDNLSDDAKKDDASDDGGGKMSTMNF